MASGRKIADEREARRCLLAAGRRGETVGQWSRANGVDGRSLNAWRVNLERRGGTGDARLQRAPGAGAGRRRALVELVPAGPAVAAAAGARYVLEVDGARLAFGDDVSVSTLRRVLEALRAC